MKAAGEMRLARRRRRSTNPEGAGTRHRSQRGDPVADAEPEAAQELARSQRPFEVAVELEVAGHPGASEADLIRGGGDIGESAGIADDDRVDSAVALRAQLALIPEAHREGEAAREAALEPRRER